MRSRKLIASGGAPPGGAVAAKLAEDALPPSAAASAAGASAAAGWRPVRDPRPSSSCCKTALLLKPFPFGDFAPAPIASAPTDAPSDAIDPPLVALLAALLIALPVALLVALPAAEPCSAESASLRAGAFLKALPPPLTHDFAEFGNNKEGFAIIGAPRSPRTLPFSLDDESSNVGGTQDPEAVVASLPAKDLPPDGVKSSNVGGTDDLVVVIVVATLS